MNCPDCGAPDDAGCFRGCASIDRNMRRTAVNNELDTLERELQACWEATPSDTTYAQGVRQGLAIAIRGVATRLQK